MYCVSGLVQLNRELKRSFKAAYAEGTFKNLKTQWNSYVSFCVFYGLDHLSSDPLVLCLYIQLLSHSMTKGAIDNYLSGARTFYRLSGVSDEHFDSIELKMIRRGLARLHPHMPVRATPVTPQILFDMYKLMDLKKSTDAVFWALFLIAFFTMSRKSNLVITKPGKHFNIIRREHVKKEGKNLVLDFHWSKNNQFGDRMHSVPLISINNSCLCPVRAYYNMIDKVKAEPQEPLFVMKQHKAKVKPITYVQFQTYFKTIIDNLGLDSSKFSSHSFRRGGATWAFKNNVPGELIQNHGDWASSAYLLYLDMSMDKKLQVSKAMSSNLIDLF